MPPKRLLSELSSCDFICRSCLSSLRKASLPARWSIRRSSQTAQAVVAATSQTRAKPADDAERLKTLKTLGLLKEDQDKGYTVNYFEQGQNGRLRRLSGPEQFGESLNDTGADPELQLKELEQSVRRVTEIVDEIEGKMGPEQLHDLKQQFSGDVGALSETNLTEEAMDEAQIEEEDEDELNDEEEDGDEYAKIRTDIPVKGISRYWQRIEALNDTLQMAAKRVKATGRVASGGGKLFQTTWAILWKDYSAARKILSPRWRIVPIDTWNLLWKVLATDSPKNPNRMHHIYILAGDMKAAGVVLSDEQQLLAIEAMFLEGWTKEAIENHRRFVGSLGAKPETFMAFWQLGLRIYCLTGDLVRAERVKDLILGSPYDADPRIVLPYIQACAKSPDGVDKGLAAYRSMRSMLGISMAIDDYDKIISYFLVANHTEQALWIFVDMMTSGSVNLRHMKSLPQSVANPFFFGKWIKRLVLSGDFDGAHNVLLLMKDKGIPPKPIQVNALIGSWLRSETDKNLKMAEDTAWTMINSRIQFVENRARIYSSLPEYMKFQPTGRGWPRANLETFSLLAENYKTRNLPKKMQKLWEAFRQAEITADSFLLNQLLFSTLQSGQGKDVPELCRSLSTEYDIEPDAYTFMALWQALPVNRLYKIAPSDVSAEVKRSRKLFAEMVSYASTFEGGIHGDLAKKIMHSFRILEDRVGMLVAFRALRQVFHFNLADAEPLVLELMIGALDLERSTLIPRNREKLIRAGQRIEHYLAHRLKELAEQKKIPRGLDVLHPEVRTVEVANFLEMHLEAEISKLPNVERLFKDAAQQMGVYNPDRM